MSQPDNIINKELEGDSKRTMFLALRRNQESQELTYPLPQPISDKKTHSDRGSELPSASGSISWRLDQGMS